MNTAIADRVRMNAAIADRLATDRVARKQAAIDQAFRNLQTELASAISRLKNAVKGRDRGDYSLGRNVEVMEKQLDAVQARLAEHLTRFPS